MKGEPGKGGFWRINPEFEDGCADNPYKKRTFSSMTDLTVVDIQSTPVKRIKRELEHTSEDSSGEGSVGCYGRCGPRRKLTNMQAFNLDLSDSVDSNSHLLNGDINWSTILSQDIEIGGAGVKTEDLLSHTSVATPSTDLWPCISETASDTDLDDLIIFDNAIKASVASDGDTLDFMCGDPLDLTIRGAGISADRDWWHESPNSSLSFDSLPAESPSTTRHCGVSSSVHVQRSPAHSWTDSPTFTDSDVAFDHFDLGMDNFFKGTKIKNVTKIICDNKWSKTGSS